MDPAQKAVFGKFPRAVGTNSDTGQIKQWMVHSPGEFDAFFEAVNGFKNVYASTSWRPVGGKLKVDKIPYDFDTPQKDDEEGWPVFGGETPPQDEIVARMRSDEYVADEVLAPVLDDAQSLVRRSRDDGVPVFCVFSGLGIHVYQFYREEENPDKQVDTTGKKYIRNLGLTTADRKVSRDVKRIMRVPNARRVHLQIRDGAIESTRPTSIYTVPVLPEELLDATPSKLLEMATEPRRLSKGDLAYLDSTNRPEMQTHEDYLESGDTRDMTQQDMRKVESPTEEGDEFLAFILEEHLRMPCMYERIRQPEPDHTVRRNCAVLLFNLGYTPGEVIDLFGRLGWRDWNREITRKQLEQIYKQGYSDMSCKTLRLRGFCTRADKPTDCSCFGWSGGKVEWKE